MPKKHQPTISRRLPDGSQIEMVFSERRQATALVHHKDGAATTKKTLTLPDGTTLAPYSPRNNLLTHGVVLFAERPAPYVDEMTLAGRIHAFIHRYVDISEAFEAITTHYILLTWLYDDFNDLPYLRVRGDYGSGKSRFLLTVGALCYKPIFASGASTTSPLFRLLDSVRGTLVIDEGDFRVSDEKAEIVKILNNGTTRGFPVLRSESTPQKEFNPRAFHVFGPKVVATRKLFDDRALESRCITEDMDGRRVRNDIPLNLPDSFEDEARELRNQLLQYRFDHLGREHQLGQHAERALTPRLAQLYAPLLSLATSEAARQAMRERARGACRTLAGDRALSVEADVLGAIAKLRRATDTLALKDLAAIITTAGTYGEVSSRWVGAVLRKQLGIVPVKSSGTFVIAKHDLPRLEHLLSKYELVDFGDNREQDSLL